MRLETILAVTGMLFMTASPLLAVTADEILAGMDKNKAFGTVTYTGVMEIHVGNEVRTKQMKTQAVSDQKALVEFTNPQDEGVKYLKLKKDLWIYFPSEQDMVKISGHLLKEGMMGSDVSYEDALESDVVRTKYSASVEKEETCDGRDCWVLLMEAKVKDAPYFRRRLWVDKELYLARKEEMYAKSGKLLKESRILEVRDINGRHFPTRVEMVNKLRKDSHTVFSMSDISFDVKLSDNLFTLQNLQR
jgi:outer membrane lipoprotein-sorting protein